MYAIRLFICCHYFSELPQTFDKMWMWMKRKTSHLVLDCVIVVRLVILHRDVEFVWASASVLNCHWKKKSYAIRKEQTIDFTYFKWQTLAILRLKCTFIQKKSECFWNPHKHTISQMDISLQAAGKQLRYSIVFSAFANHIYMENCKSLCTLFHISVANCKWGSVCSVESRTLLLGVCKLRTGESLMYLRHNHLCN